MAKIHRDTWHMKAKCQGVIMHEMIVGDKLAWVTHSMENARCQVDCMRCYTPRPNQFSGIEEKMERREENKERKKERKEEKKREEEPVPMRFWLPSGKILRTRSEVCLRSKR